MCINVYLIQMYIYLLLANRRNNMKYTNGFLYVQKRNKQCKLLLPGTFNIEDKNFLEIGNAEAFKVNACCGINKTSKALMDNFKC